ncbi:MAG: prolyl oligopeptidase family serine peptidase [Bacteroidetes bacterium]|nr:prolyl oligopeptidase family serine peptidase [Bacteroidota bacterium]
MSKHSFMKIFILIILFAASINAQTSLKDETRFPWGTATGGFMQDWLIIGGFPNQDGKGFDNDYLQEHDGELKIQPVPGMTHKLLNGSTFEWKKYHSPYNYINFFDILENVEYSNKVGYAYANVQRPAEGKVILSFGHNVSNKLWVNGKLVYESRTDNQAEENNHIEVEMAKGSNSILIKSIHGGWTWGFRFRIIEPKNISLIHDFKLSPEIVKSGIKDKLVIKTDRSLNPEIQRFYVNVKAVAAGGKVIAEKNVKRCEQITFDTKKWPNGVYDIYFKTNSTDGEIMTAYLYWYKGDAVKEAKELLSSVPKNPQTPEDYHHRMLGEMLTQRLNFNPDKIDSSVIQKLYSPLMEYEELLLDKTGKKGSVRAEGFVRLTYIDPVDNTPQFCRAYLPLNYNPKQKWPLVVALHGYNGANPVYVNWWSIDARHNEVVDKYPIIYIEPHGRGNTSYMGIGDQDILKCIELAKQKFNLDEDRIYLKGESMGGGGTWNVGTRHPELFAAIAPVYGGWDYHVRMSEEEIAKLSDRALFNAEASSSLSHADALLTTPVFVIHGDIDKSVDVNNSRYLVKTLQRWGYDVQYHEYPGFGHEGIEYYDKLIPWFLKHKRNANPEKVRVRSTDLKYASAHWAKVTQLDKPNSFVAAEAEVLVNNTIKLSTENVLEIELTPSAKLIDPKKPVKIIWNVNDIRDTRVIDGRITVRDKNYKPAHLYKTPKIPGKISDLTATPFVVVIGTISKDSLMVKAINTKAQQFISYWKNWQKYEPRSIKDVDVTEADMKKYSLYLLGGPAENKVSNQIFEKTPFKITDSTVTIDGRLFKAKDAVLNAVYPNPYNNERYVNIVAATSGAGFCFFDPSNDELSAFDYYIADGRVPVYSIGAVSDKIRIAIGLFDNNWKIDDAFLNTGDENLRSKCAFMVINSDLSSKIVSKVKPSVELMKSFEGTYKIENGPELRVYLENDTLKVVQGQFSAPLIATSDSEFYVKEANASLSFPKNVETNYYEMIVYQNGAEIKSKKAR